MLCGNLSRVSEIGCVGCRREVKCVARESLTEKVTFEPRLEGGKGLKIKPPTDLPSRSLPALRESRLFHKRHTAEAS